MTVVSPWNPDAGGPQYQYARLADHLAARIAAGEFPPDSRLPGERELSQEYSVALGTVRRALGELAGRGLTITVPARGTFVVTGS